MSNKKLTIDCTPTWEGILNWYLAVLEDGNREGKSIAKKELLRMAQAADSYNAWCKEVNDREISIDEISTSFSKTTIGEFLKNRNDISIQCVSIIRELHRDEDFFFQTSNGTQISIKRIS